MPDHSKVAYFSMEIDLDEGMPTYSGGLGILAGDTIRAAADLKIPLVAVTLLHRQGYFQRCGEKTRCNCRAHVCPIYDRFHYQWSTRRDLDLSTVPGPV